MDTTPNVDTEKLVDEFISDKGKFYQFLILGQWTYNALLHLYIFSSVCQDSKRCGRLVRCLPKERILRCYVAESIGVNVWSSNNYGISEKIRRSYAILGFSYHQYGFDKTFSILSSAIANEVSIFLKLPTENYTRPLKSSYAQNYSPIYAQPFRLNTGDYEERDHLMIAFCETYGLDCLFARFSLLTRSQMGLNAIDTLGINPKDVFGSTKVSHLKRSLVNLGQELLLLQVLDYQLSEGNLELLDLPALDITSINIGQNEVHDQLFKILRIEDFSEYLFDKLNVPISISLTSQDKKQLTANFISAFFLSNFSPDNKFAQSFESMLHDFYSDPKFSIKLDYRYALIAFLSAFDIRAKTNNYEVGDGIFHAEIQLGDNSNAPVFICEDESMRYAKKNVWKKAYEGIVLASQRFLTTTESCMKENDFLFIAEAISRSRSSNLQFYKNFGIINASNFESIGLPDGQIIMTKVSDCFSDDMAFAAFIHKVASLNRNKYIVVENRLYEYSELLLVNFSLSKIASKGIVCTSRTIASKYPQIINPTDSIYRLLIDADYRLVRQITLLPDEIAKYALDKNLDAYNYINVISHEVQIYYDQRVAQVEKSDGDNLGLINKAISEAASLCILDSQKSVSDQMEELISDIDINRVTLACGYCFASGLKLLDKTIKNTVYADVPVDFYIGSLQNYNDATPDNLITGIDRATIKLLNEYLCHNNVSLFTCKDRFYHGKLYIFESTEKTVICFGSSNISRSAYISNYELNVALIVPSDSDIKRSFDVWVQQLRHYSRRIYELNESMFGDNEIRQDGSVILKQISHESIQRRINELTNAEVQYRLNLWMSYSPDVIAEDLGILTLPNYIAFVFRGQKLLALESFSAGNAYFCINYENSFEDVINSIAAFSKTEIFEYSKMTKRGYHISNKFTLESNIRKYWLFAPTRGQEISANPYNMK